MKRKPNYTRYTKWTDKFVQIVLKESDGNGFFMYKTRSGHTLYSRYEHAFSMLKPTNVRINFDTEWQRWRLVEVLEA